VCIGPFAVIEPDVAIGDECQLASHVVVKQGTTLGPRNRVFEGAVLGGLPQHIHPPDRPGELIIGADNTIREHVTIHRALTADVATRIGNHNLLMIGVHIAHDCALGDHVIFANGVLLAGHVTVDDRAYVSGAVGVHQFCRIGRMAMVGGQAHVIKDVPPYVTVDGVSTCIVGLNLVGLRRNGMSLGEIRQLKHAYRLIYRSGLPWSMVIERLAIEFADGPAAEFNSFFAGGRRGFTPARTLPEGATLRLRDESDESLPPTERLAG
jgi:UDP-N-acetylglucosamine acyltransferase